MIDLNVECVCFISNAQGIWWRDGKNCVTGW